MTPTPGSSAEPSRMEAFKASLRKAVMIFIVLDLVFIGGAAALYFGVFRPQMSRVEAARDEAVRAGLAMRVRARAVEARYALTVMDVPGAKMAAGDVHAGLLDLAQRVPADRGEEATAVRQLVDRAALIESALDNDPNAARGDLEVVEGKLATLYPVAAGRSPGK